MRRKAKNPKEHKRKRRHLHVRRRLVGTAERPRVCVFRSNTHIYAQIIDDEQGKTLAAVSSLKISLPKATPAAEQPAGKSDAEGQEGKKGKKKGGKKPKAEEAKILQAREVGTLVAKAAKEKGINAIRFDRGGYLYHGRVAALAKAMREGGLEF
ncbi:MAG: 50S ribosomal protein L18 [Candidatus Krumholzibacteria bacterium]|nr:50S ribosomal protein L18 [Candidatus Krumholzibacteria bacterium]